MKKSLALFCAVFAVFLFVPWVPAGPVVSPGVFDGSVPSQDSTDNDEMQDVIGNKTDTAAAASNTTSIVAVMKEVYSVVSTISSSIFTLTETGGTLTTDGTEQNVYINNAPSGVYSPKDIFLDFTAHTAAETVVVREYYRIKSGGNFIMMDEVTFVGVQDPLLIHVEMENNRYGMKVTMEKTVGTNRAYDYEVFYAL